MNNFNRFQCCFWADAPKCVSLRYLLITFGDAIEKKSDDFCEKRYTLANKASLQSRS